MFTGTDFLIYCITPLVCYFIYSVTSMIQKLVRYQLFCGIRRMDNHRALFDHYKEAVPVYTMVFQQLFKMWSDARQPPANDFVFRYRRRRNARANVDLERNVDDVERNNDSERNNDIENNGLFADFILNRNSPRSNPNPCPCPCPCPSRRQEFESQSHVVVNDDVKETVKNSLNVQGVVNQKDQVKLEQ